MTIRHSKRALTSALALSLGLALTACGGMAQNRTVYSTKQPVVERSTVVLDVNTNASGLPVGEQRRVAEWFDAMDLRYGDKVSVDDPLERPETRAAVADVAGRYGILLADSAPATGSDLQPGQARVVLVRTRASVPGCPDWSASSDATLGNGLSPNYGCANNGNLAAMVANPEDLIKGQKGSADTYINTSNSTIKTYNDSVGKKVNVATVGNAGGN